MDHLVCYFGNFMPGCLECNSLNSALLKSESRGCTGLCDCMSTSFNSQKLQRSTGSQGVTLGAQLFFFFFSSAPFLIPRAGRP